jgi:hypothetical protein
MRNAFLGALAIAGLWMLVAGAAGGRDRVSAAGPATEGVGQELVTLATPVGEKGQMLTIVDPRTRAICVYHVELATGAIALKSARNIHWDLQMTDYNGVSPLPGELRSMFGQK